jgi:hypothetical protein
VFFRVALKRGEMIVENEFLLVEQAPDQRRLAVVDRAAGEKAQRRAQIKVGRARGPGAGKCHRAAHQK